MIQPMNNGNSVMSGIPVGVSAMINYSPPPTYTKHPCDLCGSMMWLGPKQVAAISAHMVPVLCVYCVARIHGENGYAPDDLNITTMEDKPHDAD